MNGRFFNKDQSHSGPSDMPFGSLSEGNPPELKVLIVILNSEDAEKTIHIYNEEQVKCSFQFRGKGTANSEILDYLGLGSSNKTINVSVSTRPRIESLLVRITKERKLRVRGNGIAFVLPVSGVSAQVLNLLNKAPVPSEITDEQLKKEVEKMKTELSYDVVAAVVNPGYSEEVMTAAKSAGATGGTVIHSRQLETETVHAFGITLEGEREIVLILIPREQKLEVMKAINLSCGLASEAQGIVLSLAADTVTGLEE